MNLQQMLIFILRVLSVFFVAASSFTDCFCVLIFDRFHPVAAALGFFFFKSGDVDESDKKTRHAPTKRQSSRVRRGSSTSWWITSWHRLCITEARHPVTTKPRPDERNGTSSQKYINHQRPSGGGGRPFVLLIIQRVCRQKEINTNKDTMTAQTSLGLPLSTIFTLINLLNNLFIRWLINQWV